MSQNATLSQMRGREAAPRARHTGRGAPAPRHVRVYWPCSSIGALSGARGSHPGNEGPMKPKKTWIVIADGMRARILRQDKRGAPLIPALNQELYEPAAHVFSRD